MRLDSLREALGPFRNHSARSDDMQTAFLGTSCLTKGHTNEFESFNATELIKSMSKRLGQFKRKLGSRTWVFASTKGRDASSDPFCISLGGHSLNMRCHQELLLIALFLGIDGYSATSCTARIVATVLRQHVPNLLLTPGLEQYSYNPY
eukprot:jgi/Botrbrau1/18962/Bobra.0798s0001.1